VVGVGGGWGGHGIIVREKKCARESENESDRERQRQTARQKEKREHQCVLMFEWENVCMQSKHTRTHTHTHTHTHSGYLKTSSSHTPTREYELTIFETSSAENCAGGITKMLVTEKNSQVSTCC